ncbi:MAG: flippase [Patescibacteria group bacterium]|jgi:O-antigen/teichoic acid export membrane protein
MFRSENRKKAALNTLFQFVTKFISMGITVIATMIITRSYGKAGYGAFSLMQSFPALFFVIVDFGLNAVAVREISKDRTKEQSFLANVLSIRLILALIFMFVLWLVLRLFPYDEALKFGITLSLLLILNQAVHATLNIVFQSRLRYDLSSIGSVIGSFIVLVLVVTLSYLKMDIAWVNFSYVLGGAVAVLVNLALVKRLHVPVSLRLDKSIVKYLFYECLPLGLMFVFSQVNFKSDSILLSLLKLPGHFNLSNTEAVAVYSLPYKVFEVSLVVPTFFMNSVYPIFVSKMLQGKENLKGAFMTSIKGLIVSALVFTLVAEAFAPMIIRILGGRDFVQSVDLLRILMSALILFYISQPFAWLLVTYGKQKILPVIYLISAAFNLTANLIFIPKYSFYASSVITILSELIILILLLWQVQRYKLLKV